MAETSCIKRLQNEYRALCKEPVSHVVARPSSNDILEWRNLTDNRLPLKSSRFLCDVKLSVTTTLLLKKRASSTILVILYISKRFRSLTILTFDEEYRMWNLH